MDTNSLRRTLPAKGGDLSGPALPIGHTKALDADCRDPRCRWTSPSKRSNQYAAEQL